MKNVERKQIEEYSKSFHWTPENFYWQHTLEVRRFALLVQQRVGGDRDVVETAALLHDIGKARLLAPGHEEIGAQLTGKFLEKINFDKEKVAKVVECIKYQNFDTTEARILRSADSMSLLIGSSKGRDWYFGLVLKGNKKRIRAEIEKSYSEIEFDFARNMAAKGYKRLLSSYS